MGNEPEQKGKTQGTGSIPEDVLLAHAGDLGPATKGLEKVFVKKNSAIKKPPQLSVENLAHLW